MISLSRQLRPCGDITVGTKNKRSFRSERGDRKRIDLGLSHKKWFLLWVRWGQNKASQKKREYSSEQDGWMCKLVKKNSSKVDA